MSNTNGNGRVKACKSMAGLQHPTEAPLHGCGRARGFRYEGDSELFEVPGEPPEKADERSAANSLMARYSAWKGRGGD
jgi:hypothetical protein